jgi:hypothetical protein
MDADMTTDIVPVDPESDVLTKAELRQIRLAAACQLRSRGASWQKIADELGYSSIKRAHEAVTRELRRRSELGPPREALRQQELENLDQMQWHIWDTILMRRHRNAGNRLITIVSPDGEEIQVIDDAPTLQAIEQLRKISESKRKLLGLDSAEKVEHSGIVHFRVMGVEPDALR